MSSRTIVQLVHGLAWWAGFVVFVFGGDAPQWAWGLALMIFATWIHASEAGYGL